jgi:hypothetical protein
MAAGELHTNTDRENEGIPVGYKYSVVSAGYGDKGGHVTLDVDFGGGKTVRVSSTWGGNPKKYDVTATTFDNIKMVWSMKNGSIDGECRVAVPQSHAISGVKAQGAVVFNGQLYDFVGGTSAAVYSMQHPPGTIITTDKKLIEQGQVALTDGNVRKYIDYLDSFIYLIDPSIAGGSFRETYIVPVDAAGRIPGKHIALESERKK